MSLTIRSSKDPYVVGYTTVDILKEKEDNTMFLWGLLLGIVGIFSLIIPVKLINTEDEFAPTPSREKARFMQYRA